MPRPELILVTMAGICLALGSFALWFDATGRWLFRGLALFGIAFLLGGAACSFDLYEGVDKKPMIKQPDDNWKRTGSRPAVP